MIPVQYRAPCRLASPGRLTSEKWNEGQRRAASALRRPKSESVVGQSKGAVEGSGHRRRSCRRLQYHWSAGGESRPAAVAVRAAHRTDRQATRERHVHDVAVTMVTETFESTDHTSLEMAAASRLLLMLL